MNASMWEKLIRAREFIRSQMLWGWRFHSLGAYCIVKKCKQVCNPKAISIGQRTLLSEDWSLVDLKPSHSESEPKIRIGSYCKIMPDFQCNASLSVEVQDYVLIAPRVFITDSDHIIDEAGERITLRSELHSAPVVIEHDCWLGVNAVILKGVRIGHHSIVGANAVVTRDVAPFSTVVGVPGRVIKAKGLRLNKEH
jgi:acetyltransferase-like isoleucine patch superfamily enzyme